MKKFILLVLLTLGMSFTQNVQAQETRLEEKTEFSLPQEEMDYIISIIKWKSVKDVKGEPDGLTEEQRARATRICGDASQESGYLCYYNNGMYYTVYYAWLNWPSEGTSVHAHVTYISSNSCCN